MSVESLADSFLPEVRKRGEDLFNKDVVSIASTSDTQVSAYVKASGNPRVSFSAEDISNPSFQANCSCPSGKKGRLCKHIWATVLKLSNEEYDFLACKTAVEASSGEPESAASQSFKARQAEYKQQQKERNKKIKQEKKQSISSVTPTYPEDVQEALSYFYLNGFEFSEPIQLEALENARRTLSRVFHPDKGGTHDEILALNTNHDVIAAYLGL